MATPAYDDQGLLLTGVRPVHRAAHRLRLRGEHGPLHWWRPRLALGAALAGAMAGALLGVAQGFLEFGVVPVALLESYGAGAGFGLSVGLVVGLLLGLLLGLAERFVLPHSVHPRHIWVRYRRSS
jgi:hypothetical protein